ncbi:MAG: PorT family protein [Tannerellaceae bacterium]|nr:PorT family protein [Tannerellaceae bacterium]
MKKITGFVVLLLLAFVVVPANAQLLRFGVKGGVNISKVHFSDKMLDEVKSSTGFQVGPIMEIGVPYTGFGIETGLLYSQQGFESENESYNSDYLDIPLLLKWKMNLPLVPIVPYLAFGPDFAFRVGTPKQIKDAFDTKAVSVGLNIGAGVQVIKHLQVGVNYTFGLTDDLAYKDNWVGETGLDTTGKNRTWSITAAILF